MVLPLFFDSLIIPAASMIRKAEKHVKNGQKKRRSKTVLL